MHNGKCNGHSRSLDMNELTSFEGLKPEAKVLVIYTGGTIGMVSSLVTGALVPASKMFEKEIRQFRDVHDEPYSTKRFGPNSNILSLPDSPERHRVIYEIREYEPLLDSSNMSVKNWEQIAEDIRVDYELYDAFVILHGTDTLAYTASALSFMLENLGKTVIVTGAQISIFSSRSDGRENFIASLIMAGNYQIPEVCVLFQNKLMRGNRSNKISSCEFDAFISKCPPLATLGITPEVDWKSVFRPFGIKKFKVNKNFDENVTLIRLHPNIRAEGVRAALAPPVSGAILETYGAGNLPTNRPEILEELAKAVENKVLIVNISQCFRGRVENIYETGTTLAKIGVVNGSDMTSVGAYTKLCYVLSVKEWDFDKRREMMSKNLRGELTAKIEGSDTETIVDTIAKQLGCSTTAELNELKMWLEPYLLSTVLGSNDLNALDTLRKNNINLSAVNNDGRTLLHIAAADGKTEIVRYLLEYGANVHIRDRYNRTPLYDAIQNGHTEVVSLLVNCGAHLNMCNYILGDYLCFAAAKGSLSILKSYKMAGVNMDLLNLSHRTALYEACLHNHPEVVEYLIKMGCQVTHKDKLGISPVDIVNKLNFKHLEKYMVQKI